MRLRWVVTLTVLAVLAAVVWIYYWATVSRIEQGFSDIGGELQVVLRPLPYPFRAAVGLTVSPGPGLTVDDYLELLAALNTDRDTRWGRGLGVEAGGSIYFHPPGDQWPDFFSASLPAATRSAVDRAVAHGWLDVVDSFGGKDDFIRDDAQQALARLDGGGRRIITWSDRFESPDDLNPSRGRGHESGKSTYHLDLTLKAGFVFFNLGRTSRILGQNAPPLTMVPRCRTANRNFITRAWLNVSALAGHLVTILSASAEDPLRENRLIGQVRFSDGSRAWEFIRYAVPGDADGLPIWLAGDCLDELIERGGRVAVELPVLGPDAPSGSGVVVSEVPAALGVLAQKAARRRILLTSVSRLLIYTRAAETLAWRVEADRGEVIIHVDGLDDDINGQRFPGPEELAGLTFYVPEADKARLMINGREVKVRRNLLDHTGRESISLPWAAPRQLEQNNQTSGGTEPDAAGGG